MIAVYYIYTQFYKCMHGIYAVFFNHSWPPLSLHHRLC